MSDTPDLNVPRILPVPLPFDIQDKFLVNRRASVHEAEYVIRDGVRMLRLTFVEKVRKP